MQRASINLTISYGGSWTLFDTCLGGKLPCLVCSAHSGAQWKLAFGFPACRLLQTQSPTVFSASEAATWDPSAVRAGNATSLMPGPRRSYFNRASERVPSRTLPRAYAPRTLACGEIPSAALRGLVAQSDECPWDRIDILKSPRASVMLGSHQKAHLPARHPPSGQRQLPAQKLPS